MNYSYLLQNYAWIAVLSRHFLSPRRFGAAAALAVALALGTGFLMGAAPGHAQDTAVAPAVQRVNINSADEQTLAAVLKGVGPSRAREIVRYRESYGPFSSVEELAEVQGISKATLDKNRTVITLE